MGDSRRRNREAIERLFQSFVDDFKSGEKIIQHLVDHAGGHRLRLPRPDSSDPLDCRSDCFRRLWRQTCREFGRETGRAVMHKIIASLGGRRVHFPNHIFLCLMRRNRKILSLYDGSNFRELALHFNLSEDQIRNIINNAGDDDCSPKKTTP